MVSNDIPNPHCPFPVYTRKLRQFLYINPLLHNIPFQQGIHMLTDADHIHITILRLLSTSNRPQYTMLDIP